MVEYLKWSSSRRYLASESAIALRSVTPHAYLLSSLHFTVKPRWPKVDGVVDVPITFSNSEPNLCCVITFHLLRRERIYNTLFILLLTVHWQLEQRLPKLLHWPIMKERLSWWVRSNRSDEHYWESIWDNQDVKHRSCDKWKRMGYT